MPTEQQTPNDQPLYLPATGSWPQSWYLLDQRTKDAIALAQACGRPLLVRGQPGTGKSDLARAAAEYLGRAFVYEVITARTEPQELQWRFDTIARLADAQAKGAGACNTSEPAQPQPANPGQPLDYVSPGVLWWALNWGSAEKYLNERCKTASQRPDRELTLLKGTASQQQRASEKGCVLLLDEIDKADSDLPNSLLEVLANTGFRLPWGTHEIKPSMQTRPLIIITTNEDRELPPAFVRRCLALRIDPGAEFEDWIKERAKAHYRKKPEDPGPRPFLDPAVLNEAARLLTEERKSLPADGPRPGLAEYLDLLRGLASLAPDDPAGQNVWLKRVYEFAYRKQPA
jgi:MoxR-like ATPase